MGFGRKVTDLWQRLGSNQRLTAGAGNVITALILVNFVGYVILCQWPVGEAAESGIKLFGDVCVGIFILEMALRVAWDPHGFFHGEDSEWNCFDLFVTLLSALAWLPWIIDIPASSILVFRSMRLFRLLRLFSRFQRIRRLVAAMFSVKTDFLWVAAVQAIIIALYAVLGTLLYGEVAPESFGCFSQSVFTLFQIMTLDGWATDEARPLMESAPSCWVFFVTFVVISSLIILNVVTGIIVDAMSEVSHQSSAENVHKRHLFERDVDFCLTNNGSIEDDEYKFLRAKAQEYGLKAKDREEIIKKRTRVFKLCCKEYKTIVSRMMKDSPNIDAAHRHHLDCKRRELGIDVRVALNLEREVRITQHPECTLSKQDLEFKDFYRVLMKTKQQLQQQFGVDDKTMATIRQQLLEEGVDV